MRNVAGDGPNLPTHVSELRQGSGVPVRSAFRRQHRLVKRDVVGLLQEGARLGKANLVVRLRENKSGSGRLAIAVPKRILKHAIDRNRVKRVIRESFRLHATRALPVDLLVTLQSHPKMVTGVGITAKPVRHHLRQTAKQLFADISLRFGRPARADPLSNA